MSIPLPELTDQQKFFIRDKQLLLLNIQHGITTLQQKQMSESSALLNFIEEIAKKAELSIDLINFDLETLTFSYKPKKLDDQPAESVNQ